MDNRVPYLYMWTHLSSGKWYVGSKSSKNCHPDNHEKYICSSRIVKPMIKENRNDWNYKILDIGEVKYIRDLEKQYLRSYNAKDDPMSFNRSNASCEYDRTGQKDSYITRKKKSLARQGELNPMFGKRGADCPHFGKTHSDLRKQNQSVGVSNYAKNRPLAHNENISRALKGNPNVGVKGERNGSYGKPAHPTAKAMSTLKNSGDNNPMRRPENQKLCEHCNKTIAKNHYTMFHGPKCKMNTDVEIV